MTMPYWVRVALFVTALLAAPVVYAQSDDYQEASKLFHAGQQAQALERVDSFLKGSPKDARARFLKGLILTEQNKTADAIKVFTDLTDDYPELPEPYNNLAVLYASQGQYDKARTELELAIRTHPSYAIAHENLGDIYAKMASQAYDKALQLDKTNTAAQTKLELIKDLFTGNTRDTKPAGKKADVLPKSGTAPAAAPTKAAPPAPTSAVPAPQAAAPKPVDNKPISKPAPVADTGNPDEVVRAVNAWASAWSNNDVSGYLGYYARDFKVPGNVSRSAWEAERKARIAKPKKIEVKVEAPKVTFEDSKRVQVTFRQNYRSSSLKTSSGKTLVMIKTGDRWLIQQERVGS